MKALRVLSFWLQELTWILVVLIILCSSFFCFTFNWTWKVFGFVPSPGPDDPACWVWRRRQVADHHQESRVISCIYTYIQYIIGHPLPRSTFSCFSAFLPFLAFLHFSSSAFHTSQLFSPVWNRILHYFDTILRRALKRNRLKSLKRNQQVAKGIKGIATT